MVGFGIGIGQIRQLTDMISLARSGPDPRSLVEPQVVMSLSFPKGAGPMNQSEICASQGIPVWACFGAVS